MAWTSRTSTALTAMSVRPRRPASVSAVWTAPVARIDGIGRRSMDQAASVTSSTSAPRRARRRRPPPADRGRPPDPWRPVPAGPSVASSGGRSPADARRATSRPSRSTTTGRRRRTVRGPRGGPPSRAGRRPSSTRRSMTTRSRSGSIAGFVTWAKAWRRWSATGRSRRPRPGGRGVVAHAPQRLVGLERHRLDVEPGPLGVEPGEVAHGVARYARLRPAWPARRGPRGPVATRRGSAGSAAPTCFASVSSRIARRPGSTRSSSPGPRRPRRTVSAALNGIAPASDATATRRSRVTANAAGRSPLRSTSAPTRWPSANTIAAGPSHGARNPAVRRRSVATCGCGARRRASASGMAASSAGVELPAGRRQQLERLVERERVRAVRREERPGREELAARAAEVAASATRPRTCSRLPRTVLISPLWAIEAERLGEPPDRVRVRRVALVEDRVADRLSGARRSGKRSGRRPPVTRPL